MGLCGNISLFMATVPLGGEATMSWKCESEWVSEWVRVTIESRTSPVFDTMKPILFVWEYLCCLTLALGMIGCIISKRKKNFFWNKWFWANCDLFFVPEKSQSIICSVCAVTLQNIMNISQSFLCDFLPILDYHQNFPGRKIRSCVL